MYSVIKYSKKQVFCHWLEQTNGLQRPFPIMKHCTCIIIAWSAAVIKVNTKRLRACSMMRCVYEKRRSEPTTQLWVWTSLQLFSTELFALFNEFCWVTCCCLPVNCKFYTSFILCRRHGDTNKKAQLTLSNPRDVKACKNCSTSTCFVSFHRIPFPQIANA